MGGEWRCNCMHGLSMILVTISNSSDCNFRENRLTFSVTFFAYLVTPPRLDETSVVFMYAYVGTVPRMRDIE